MHIVRAHHPLQSRQDNWNDHGVLVYPDIPAKPREHSLQAEICVADHSAPISTLLTLCCSQIPREKSGYVMLDMGTF